jgi:hypothetical protein
LEQHRRISPASQAVFDSEVWEKASIIAAELGNDYADQFATRHVHILRDTADPQDWRRLAVAVDVIAAASKQ